MTDLALGLILVVLSIAGLWLPLSRPEIGKWVSQRALASEWLALAVVVGLALGITFAVSGALGHA
jgi:hypothetical protein